MTRNKTIFSWIPVAAIELVFWFSAISVAIFVNISSRALRNINIFSASFLLVAFLIIILSRILPHITSPRKRLIFIAGIGIIALTAFLLIGVGAANLVIFYYLPASIAISMAFLVIIEPRSPVIILVAVCIFILGEAFWGIHITADQGLRFPSGFFRIFSLTLVTLFTYYLYRKETSVRKELDLLNAKLKSLNSMKSDFVINVSHELRTPLTSIRNATVLLKRKIKTGEKAISISKEELLDIISSNIDRQSKLIDALLDLSRIEKGELSINRTSLDIATIAREVIKSLTMQASGKNIQVITEIEDNLPKVYATEDQIAEVYTNLLDNAIKYTKQNGRVLLRISLSNDEIESVVEDTGIGISQEDLGRIFDKFVRLRDALKHKEKGVGLGLVITKAIIELHRGRIWVESKLGAGSKFMFTLPMGLRKVDQKR